MRRILFSFVFIVISASLFAVAATVDVDYTTETAPFNYRQVLGNNFGVWTGEEKYDQNLEKIRKTGSYLLRFPGGSLSNEYHWNGTGTYTSENVWVSDDTNWSPGFIAYPLYRGSSSLNYGHPGNLTDGDLSTEWVSDTITAAAVTTNAYAIVSFDSGTYVDEFEIEWGSVYAEEYEIQYWDPPSGWEYQWAPHQGDADYWVTALVVTGNTGGTDIRAISRASQRNYRILMKKSSAKGYRIKEIYLRDGTTQQTVNSDDTNQTKTIASPMNIAVDETTSWEGAFSFEAYMDFMNNMGEKAIPCVSVNFGTGTPQEAAAWVHYANIVKGYDIKYWEIGNEMEGAWEGGGPVDAEYYTKKYIRIAEAMKAVDPAIKICGPVLAGLKNSSELYDGNSFLEKFFMVLQEEGKQDLVDVIDFHIYANWSNDNAAETLGTPSDWTSGPDYKGFLDSLLTTYYGSANAKEIFLSEYNSGNAALFTMKLENGIWWFNWMGEYIKSFGSRAYATLWDVMNNNASTGNYDHGYIENGSHSDSKYRFQERSSYWAMYMMNNYFAVADDYGNTLVSASSDQTLLPVYANKRSDGKLSLAVINKDPSNPYEATINISGFSPDSSSDIYTFAGAENAPYYVNNYEWHEADPSSYADPGLAPEFSNIDFASSSFAFTFPAYSVSVFQFVPAGSTPTLTPTITYTATITMTPTPTEAGCLMDDCEDSDNQNDWGGYWYTYADASSAHEGFLMTSPGADSSSYAARVTGYVEENTGNYPYVGMGCQFNENAGEPECSGTDISACGGIRFTARGDGGSYKIQIPYTDENCGTLTDWNDYKYAFTVGGTWTEFTVPFTSMTQEDGWGIPADINDVLANAKEIQWVTTDYDRAVDLWIDNVIIYGCETCPDQYTATPTHTETPVVTPVSSPTLTITPTPQEGWGAGKYMENLDEVYIYPSLVDMNEGDKKIVFKKLTENIYLRIYNIQGGLVYEKEYYCPKGNAELNLSNLRRNESISPGIYIYIIKGNGQYKKGKFAVIR